MPQSQHNQHMQLLDHLQPHENIGNINESHGETKAENRFIKRVALSISILGLLVHDPLSFFIILLSSFQIHNFLQQRMRAEMNERTREPEVKLELQCPYPALHPYGTTVRHP